MISLSSRSDVTTKSCCRHRYPLCRYWSQSASRRTRPRRYPHLIRIFLECVEGQILRFLWPTLSDILTRCLEQGAHQTTIDLDGHSDLLTSVHTMKSKRNHMLHFCSCQFDERRGIEDQQKRMPTFDIQD